jgi:hypothetical protein
MPHEKTIRQRNPRRPGRVAPSVIRRGLSVLALALVVLSVAAPAGARPRVFIGGVLGGPYPYAYPPPYYYAYPPPYGWAPYPGSPPPGWMAGHWERRYDREGRSYDVWVPPHLQ